MATSETTKPSSPLLIAAAWLIVLLPTAWGLNYTIRNAAKIFSRPAATTAAPAQPTK